MRRLYVESTRTNVLSLHVNQIFILLSEKFETKVNIIYEKCYNKCAKIHSLTKDKFLIKIL